MTKAQRITRGFIYIALSMAAAFAMFHVSFLANFAISYGQHPDDNHLLAAVTLVPIHLTIFAFPGVLPYVFRRKFKLYVLPSLLCILAYQFLFHEVADFPPDTSMLECVFTSILWDRWMILAFCLLIALRAVSPSIRKQNDYPH